MPLTYCFQCGKYLRLGQKREWGTFCNKECFEKYTDTRKRLFDLKLEYWKETHPQLLNYYYDRRKIGGWYPVVGEE